MIAVATPPMFPATYRLAGDDEGLRAPHPTAPGAFLLGRARYRKTADHFSASPPALDPLWKGLPYGFPKGSPLGRRRGVAPLAFLAAWVLIAFASAAAAGPTLDAVRARGQLNCGVNAGLAGFSAPDDKGSWTGLDVDFCRAVAAAIFGPAAKIKFVPLTAKERFTALQSGEIDLLARNTTWSMSRDTTQGLTFSVVNYYDGQGFMVKKASGITSAKQLKGATVCVQSGTTSELNLADYFRTNNLDYRVVVFEKQDESLSAYNAGRCDAFTTDASGLYSERLKLGAVADHVVLPEIISKEPLGPAVRQGDEQWAALIRWTHFALVGAEELGITAVNVGQQENSANPEIRRFVGLEGDFGKGLGLPRDWAVRIVSSVGNYGESFDRNLGEGSRIAIARGLNRLWTQGGLQYAPPIR